jgi:hypothetical protein
VRKIRREIAPSLDLDDCFGYHFDGHGVAQGHLMSRILFTTALSISKVIRSGAAW